MTSLSIAEARAAFQVLRGDPIVRLDVPDDARLSAAVRAVQVAADCSPTLPSGGTPPITFVINAWNRVPKSAKLAAKQLSGLRGHSHAVSGITGAIYGTGGQTVAAMEFRCGNQQAPASTPSWLTLPVRKLLVVGLEDRPWANLENSASWAEATSALRHGEYVPYSVFAHQLLIVGPERPWHSMVLEKLLVDHIPLWVNTTGHVDWTATPWGEPPMEVVLAGAA